jgi:hypothetical protein
MRSQYGVGPCGTRSLPELVGHGDVAMVGSGLLIGAMDFFAQNEPLSARNSPCCSGEEAFRMTGDVFGNAKPQVKILLLHESYDGARSA